MSCKQCEKFINKGAQPFQFEEFEGIFEITEIQNYPMACTGKAYCKYCKHSVQFSYEEILLIKLWVEDFPPKL